MKDKAGRRLDTFEVGMWPRPSLKFFGHSYMEGLTGPSKQTLRFSTRIAALLNAREENYGWHGAVTLYAAVGSTPWLSHVPPRVAPFAAATDGAMIYTGINDFGGNLVSDANLTVSWLRCMTHWLRAQQRMTVQDSAYCVPSQGTGASAWQQNTLSYGPSGDQWKGVTGNYMTVTTPSTFPGGSLRLWYAVQLNTGGVHTVTVNGAAATTKDTRGSTLSTVKPVCVELTGLAPGVNTIVDTLSAVASGGEQWVYAEYAAATPPPVVLANINRAPSYTANGGAATDSAVTAQNILIAAMVAEFTDGRVVLLDVDTLLNKQAVYFAGDNLHLSDAGNEVVAVAAAKLFRPLLMDSNAFASTKANGPESLHRLRVDAAARGTNGTSTAMAGTATLVAGAVTITTKALGNTTTDQICYWKQTGASTGALRCTAKTVTANSSPGTFTITSSDSADTDTIFWMIVSTST